MQAYRAIFRAFIKNHKIFNQNLFVIHKDELLYRSNNWNCKSVRIELENRRFGTNTMPAKCDSQTKSFTQVKNIQLLEMISD